MTFRTRQAPSPTGYLHIGTARTVLFTKLMAKANNGVFYLRLEDTDRNRLMPETAKILLNALSSIGLAPDEGITLETVGQADDFYQIYQKGEYGPYIQSERVKTYHEHAQNLIDKGLAYWSYLTTEEKEELQEIKNIVKKPINYHKICLEKFGEEKMYISVKEALQSPEKPVLLYKIQRNDKLICHDLLLGNTEFDLSLEEDFAILKSDGFPTYHLAHLVDDHLMQTTLAIRGQEWYASIARNTQMFLDYWQQTIQYMHVPVILGETGNKKMSKRDGNVNMQGYLDTGFLPEAILNYLAFLGWNPGNEKELYLEKEDFINLNQSDRLAKLIDNLAKDFAIEKLSRSPARFNLEKLNWFNREYIKMLSLDEFTQLAYQNLNDRKYPERKLRIGDYVAFVDLEKQQILAEINQDKKLGLIGGGRDAGENSIQGLLREVQEETLSQVKIDTNKLIKINTFNVFDDFNYKGEDWNGKELNNYFYPLSKEIISDYTIEDNEYKWMDLNLFLTDDQYPQQKWLSYPVWRNFCQKNQLKCVEPNEIVVQEYLAWNLDKKRITVLSEFGTESNCILRWQKPDLQEIKWKKISLEESLQNLQEITSIIQNIYPKTEQYRTKLHNSVLIELDNEPESNLEQNLQNLVNFWENELKSWLNENQKDIGSYLWPLRVSLSGKTQSPSPFELLAVLNLEQIQERLDFTKVNS